MDEERLLSALPEAGDDESSLRPQRLTDYIGLPQLAMHSCYETAGAEDTL